MAQAFGWVMARHRRSVEAVPRLRLQGEEERPPQQAHQAPPHVRARSSAHRLLFVALQSTAINHNTQYSINNTANTSPPTSATPPPATSRASHFAHNVRRAARLLPSPSKPPRPLSLPTSRATPPTVPLPRSHPPLRAQFASGSMLNISCHIQVIPSPSHRTDEATRPRRPRSVQKPRYSSPPSSPLPPSRTTPTPS